MGTCYTMMIMDELDWNYKGFGGSEKIKEMLFKEFPDIKLKGQDYGLLLFDIGKLFPVSVLKKSKVPYDRIMWRPDNNLLSWSEYTFKEVMD